MREGDLKLERMASLIPTKKARREIDKFFADKRKEREKSKPASKVKKTSGNSSSIKKELLKMKKFS